MQYELIDQTGEQFGRNRQWLITVSDGNRTRAFCAIPAWEDYPAGQIKADAEHVLRQLQAEDERNARRAQVAALVEAAEICVVELKDWMKSHGEDVATLHAIQIAKVAIAAAEGGAE